ncbi:MAG: LacI family DNA-binding transcriptional regulator [Opitutaceae bacterium]
MRIVGIREVARKAGVHASTVSLALRLSPRVHPTTRERIVEVARKLGYRSLPGVRQLMFQLRTGRAPAATQAELALISCVNQEFPVDGNPIVKAVFRGAATEAGTLGYRLERFVVGPGHLSQTRLRQILVARGIQGCLVYPGQFVPESDPLAWGSFAWVRIGHTLQPPRIPEVVSNHLQLLKLALEHATARGECRIALALTPAYDRVTLGAYVAGFLEWQHRRPAGILLEPLHLSDDLDAAASRLRSLVTKVKPEVVVVPNARALAPVMKRAGLVPSSLPPCISLHVSTGERWYAGIDQRDALLGAMAVRQLDGAITRFRTGLEAEPAVTLVDGVWRDGPSFQRALVGSD